MVLGILCVSAALKKMRATWLTAVANIDWPMSSTKTVEAQQAELLELLDVCVETNMNTVLLHIRPACDALYKSKYEPWSSYLNHGRGVDPGYDPLQFCIDECHKRGLTCHGWINPYRYGKRGGYDWTGNDDTTQLNYKHTHQSGCCITKTIFTLILLNPKCVSESKRWWEILSIITMWMVS